MVTIRLWGVDPGEGSKEVFSGGFSMSV